MNKSIRWIVLAVLVGVGAIGGTWAGLSFNNEASNAQAPATANNSNDAGQASNGQSTGNGDGTQAGAGEPAGDNTQVENTQAGNAQTGQPAADAEDLIDILIGDGLIDVDKIEIKSLEVNDNDDGMRLDDWLRKQAPEASRSIIRRWMREDRVAVNNVLISQASHPLASLDNVQFTFTEFSAMKLYLNEQLANPFREEYDLFALTITGQYVKNKSVTFLGVGPLFNNDVSKIPNNMKGRNSLPNWDRAYYTADFGEYRFYELE